MLERPPRIAERLLSWALGPSDSARSALGDLAEDFARQLPEDLGGRVIARVAAEHRGGYEVWLADGAGKARPSGLARSWRGSSADPSYPIPPAGMQT